MKKKEKNKETIRGKIADSFSASKEVLLDVAKITFIGNREVTVENYKSIGEYSEKKIVLETNPHSLVIQGSRLEIKSMAREIIFITGEIGAVMFKREV